jgi:hypothetical protein
MCWSFWIKVRKRSFLFRNFGEKSLVELQEKMAEKGFLEEEEDNGELILCDIKLKDIA